MRRLGIRGLDSLQFDALDGLRDLLLLRLRPGQQPRLLQHHLVQLVVLMLQMREVRFQFLQPFGEVFVHATT